MKINERILKRLFGLMQNKYPYIIDMDYEYDEDYNPFVNSDIHNFKLYVDLDMIGEMFPEYTFDLKFINGHMSIVGCVNVTEMFNEFAEDEEFFQLVEAGGPTRQLGRVGEMQGDDGFQIVRDDFFGAGFFQGLRDDAAELEKAVAFGKGGGVGGARGGE